MNLQRKSLKELDDILQEWRRLASAPQYERYGTMPDIDGTKLVTRAHAIILRIAGQSSAYGKQAASILNRNSGNPAYDAQNIAGVVEALREDVAKDYLKGIAELIHAEVFGDFLEMAQHLQAEKYKDAAAVIAGSALEAHLRRLCEKANIPTETSDENGMRPKKADAMNSELAKGEVYSKLDQKNVTAWLDLRNKAAHGHYDKYESSQVRLLIDGVRDFITRNPA